MLHPRRLLLLALLSLTTNISVAFGQNKPAGPERFAVDIVTLNTRDQYRGAFLGRLPSGQLQVALQRDWLKKQHPKLFETATAEQERQRKAAAEQFENRLKSWLDEQPEPGTLRAFLQLELRRTQQAARGDGEQPEPPQFVIVEFPEARVRSLVTQATQNRAVAMLAWRERLAGVETKQVEELRKELTSKGVNLNDVADLSDRLPLLPQDDREWAARRAILEHQHGDGLEFQGFGDALFQSGEGAKQVELSQLLGQLFEKQLGSQLSELLGESQPARKTTNSNAALQKAVDAAVAKGQRAVRVTLLELDVASGRVTVTGRLLARMPNDRWESVWQSTVVEDGSQPRADLERRIEDDPQIKGLKQTLGDLGLQQELSKALRFGAATMAAQQAADKQFNQFRDQYVRKLDVPPLRWSSDNASVAAPAKPQN